MTFGIWCVLIMVGQNVSLVIYSLENGFHCWSGHVFYNSLQTQENVSGDVRIRFQDNIQLSLFNDPILISYISVYSTGGLKWYNTFVTRTVFIFWV